MLPPSEATRRGLLRSAWGDWVERLVAHTDQRVVSRRYGRPPGGWTGPTVPSSFELTYVEG